MGLEKVFLEKREKFNQSGKHRQQQLGNPKGIQEYCNIPYAKDSNLAHRMDIFQPLHIGEDKLPVIINIHGGGMILGNKEFNRYFCAELCKHGFLVFSVEYSLVPEVRVFEQFSDIALAMNQIAQLIPQYQGNQDKVYLVGDSAGAYLSVYTAAMQKSKRLAKAAKITPSTLKIRAMGLISGMFYTTKLDEIGLFLPNYLYGKGYKKQAFAPYVNPEHPDIVRALPPLLLITSKCDNLRHYTLNYDKALSRCQKEHELLYFSQNDKALSHAFCVFEPYRKESLQTIEKIVQFLRTY